MYVQMYTCNMYMFIYIHMYTSIRIVDELVFYNYVYFPTKTIYQKMI